MHPKVRESEEQGVKGMEVFLEISVLGCSVDKFIKVEKGV